MASKTLRNASSATIYRDTELLLLACLDVAERTPKSGGIHQVSNRLVDNLLDALTTIGLALNESNKSSKLELIDAFYLQFCTIKTCLDVIKEWSGRGRNTRVISNKQMPRFVELLEKIAKQTILWRNKTREQL